LEWEAGSEAGHEGDYDLKLKTIEYLDKRVVKYIIEKTSEMEEHVSIAILPDHPTPWKLKTHTRDAVPFLIYKPGLDPDEVEIYDENSVKKGIFGTLKSEQFMKVLLQ